MTGNINDWTNDIHRGDVRETLGEMPDSSVHCVMTSPPYYGLRDYGEGIESIWGGDEECDHEWKTEITPVQGGENTDENRPDVGADENTQETRLRGGGGIESDKCRKCGAWRGQLGLEPTLGRFVANLVEVGDAIREVLRDDGSWWLNLGDSYAGSGRGQWDGNDDQPKESYTPGQGELPDQDVSLPRKSKMLVPHRVAIALQDAGWIVRNDVVWKKPNPTPHPVKDRLNTTFEYVFHLVPQPDYYYDLDAIREPHAEQSIARRERADSERYGPDETGDSPHTGFAGDDLHPGGKNPGDVFEVSTKPFSDAHFAVYPPELCEKPIKATCPEQVCVACGTPYDRERDVERREVAGGVSRVPEDERGCADRQGQSQNDRDGMTLPTDVSLGEWETQCDCETDDTKPGIVLDPFAGAGTTCKVAKDHGRRFVGVELNPEYVAMAQDRVGVTVTNPEHLRDDDGQSGIEDYT